MTNDDNWTLDSFYPLNARHVVKELLERGDGVGANVVKLLHQLVGALLSEHRGRHVGFILKKSAIVGRCELKLDVY